MIEQFTPEELAIIKKVLLLILVFFVMSWWD